MYDAPANDNTGGDSASKVEEKRVYAPKAPSKGISDAVFIKILLLV